MTTTATIHSSAVLEPTSTVAPLAVDARLAREDGGPWLFLCAPASFALIVLIAAYVAKLSF